MMAPKPQAADRAIGHVDAALHATEQAIRDVEAAR